MMRKLTIIRTSAYGLAVMGLVHIVATFTPVISAKLAPLAEGMRGSVIYFSLMCGALLILGGLLTAMLASKLRDYPFLRKPYLLTIVVMALDGGLAVCQMPHNPCAWIILALSLPLLAVRCK